VETDNTHNYTQPHLQSQAQTEESFDYKIFFFKIYRHWYFFVLTIIVSLIIAFLFNKYTKPVYEVSTTVIIKSDRGNKIDPQQLIGLGFRNDLQNIENEIGVLSSYSLTERTIKNLDFFVSYFEEENFISKEQYGNNPFEVVYDTSHLQPVNVEFKVKVLSASKYAIQVEVENATLYDFGDFKEAEEKYLFLKVTDTLYFGEQLEGEAYSFHLALKPNANVSELVSKNLNFVFKDLKSLVTRYQGITIEPINKDASILKLSLRGFNEAKSVAFLNTLTREYLAQGLEKKNLIATNTIRFIDDQLMEISDSLSFAELELQDFRSENVVMDIDFQSQQAVNYMKTLETQQADLKVKNMYYKSLKKYVETNKDIQEGLIVPSAMGIDDPLTTSLIQELNTLFNQRAEALLTSTEKNPTVIALDLRIENTKNALLENVTNIVKNSDIALRDVGSRINALTSQMTTIPKTQRELLGITRKFTLSDNIYNFLQQRRAEAQITRASNVSDNEIVDAARLLDATPVYPKKSLNYMIAIVLGLVLPVLYILGKDYLNDKIVERSDIEKITQMPIIGHTIHSNRLNTIVVAESPKSSIAESFRSIRTNLVFATKGKTKMTVLVTSDMVSAGKTFVSINLASIFALYGKKTMLLGFDLRKPKIYQDFGLSTMKGSALSSSTGAATKTSSSIQ